MTDVQMPTDPVNPVVNLSLIVPMSECICARDFENIYIYIAVKWDTNRSTFATWLAIYTTENFSKNGGSTVGKRGTFEFSPFVLFIRHAVF